LTAELAGRRRAEAVGYLRVAVGLGLIMAPYAVARLQSDASPSGSRALLIRTVGIRDVVLGIGTVMAARSAEGDTSRWVGLGLMSDTLDVVAGAISASKSGTWGDLAAAAVPVPVILADLRVLAALRGRRPGQGRAPARRAVAPG
jgi:hypothetical protein